MNEQTGQLYETSFKAMEKIIKEAQEKDQTVTEISKEEHDLLKTMPMKQRVPFYQNVKNNRKKKGV